MPGLSLIGTDVGARRLRFPSIAFCTSADAARNSQTYVTRIARTEVLFDQPMPMLGAQSSHANAFHHPGPWLLPERAADITGSGWIGQALRGFRGWIDASGQTVLFDDGAAFRVSSGGDRIDAFALPDDDAHRSELLLGPALLLALGSRGIFGLHASAVLGRAGAVLLLGPSGSGKSTLARHAIGEGGLRLTDDVSPVVITQAGPRLLPRFPQLKLAPALTVDDLELPIAAMLWVGIADRALTMTHMHETEVSHCLLRDSVAARLFAPDVLARHLDACAALAMTVPGWRLTVPRAPASETPQVIHAAYQLLRAQGLP